MLGYVFRKMANNRGMTAFLFTGMLLAVAVVSAIPLYTSGILQKVLIGDLEGLQRDTGEYPGYYRVVAEYRNFADADKARYYGNLKDNLSRRMVPELSLPAVSVSEEDFVGYFGALPAKQREENPVSRLVSLYARPDLETHVEITHGRMCSAASPAGVFEVVVPETFLRDGRFMLDEELSLEEGDLNLPGALKIVGTFRIADPGDTRWRSADLKGRAYLAYDAWRNRVLDRGIPLIQSSEWNYALDYRKLDVRALGRFLAALDTHQAMARKYSASVRIDFSGESILREYASRARQLGATLSLIEIPVLVLLLFYILLITDLIVAGEENEIAVLKSRGKSSRGIFLIYLAQVLILGAAALAAGPPLGYVICLFMGASNGFLEFVRRAPLEVSLSGTAYLYALAALALIVAVMMAPIYGASRKGIVEVKQKKARDQSVPFWKRAFLDLALLLLSLYGYFRYAGQKAAVDLTRVSGADMGMDPILFLTSSLFILGAGLLFIRLFPYLVNGVFRLGKKNWSPVAYYALLQVSRTGKRGQFLMLFLLFSIAMGVFDANMARTLNKNAEDRVRYKTGADIALTEEWEKETKAGSVSADSYDSGTVGSSSTSVHYREPSFYPFRELEGVERATRVFMAENGRAGGDGSVVNDILVQGIDPEDFGRVAWFRTDLLKYHWYYYLNFLADAQNALLVSSNLARQLKLSPGDWISLTLGDQEYAMGVVYGIVDYWPGYSPLDDSGDPRYLVVANLDYLQNKFAKEPYAVWLKKLPHASDRTVYDSLEAKGLPLLSLTSAEQLLIKEKNDPLLKGINGALTQGFILIVLVCVIGFLNYWGLSMKGRTLQFGILRAVGLSRRALMGILTAEQAMVSAIPVFAGVFIGGVASYLFVPFLQLVFSPERQIPPFLVQAYRSDYLKIYAIIFGMLVLGASVLFYYVRRLRIGSALKLGED